MHIGLNCIFLVPGETGGMETYARELIAELVAAAPQHRFTCFVNREAAAAADGPWGTLCDQVTVPVHASDRLQWVRGEQLLLPRAAERAGCELVHSLASTAPATGRFARVVTIHDLIYKAMPEAHRGLRARGMAALVPLAARRAHRIIADSRATRDDLVRHLRTPVEKIDVVPLGLGRRVRATPSPEAEVRAAHRLGDRPLLLTVSAKRAHKNLAVLLDALVAVEPARRPVLVLPGYPTDHERQLREHAAALGLDDDVRFVGWLDAAGLEGLYAAAAAFVFPSRLEGFGLPVLEAMARGVPVACSDASALPEVAGDAALLFDPSSAAGIAGAITRLLGDAALAAHLADAGRERAARFTWRRTAELTLAAYTRA